MKTVLYVISIYLLAFTIGCGNGNSLSIQYMDVGETDEVVHKWIESKSVRNGVYLGRDVEGKLYVYINYRNEENADKFTVSSVDMEIKNKKLIIGAIPLASDHSFEKIFVVRNAKFNGIELNRHELKLDQIEDIR